MKKKKPAPKSVSAQKAKGKLAPNLPKKALSKPAVSKPEPEETFCVGCKAEGTTLVPLPRDTNPKDLFPDFVRDKSRGCISCVYHAILVRQVRDAMSYKLDAFSYERQCCLVCNVTTGLVALKEIEGAREAVSHPIINAQNIEKYLKTPCKLCTCCAYPLQWLYQTVLLRDEPPTPPKLAPKSKPAEKVTISRSGRRVAIKGESDDDEIEEVTEKAATTRSGRRVAIKVESEDKEVTQPRSSRSRPSTSNTPKPSPKTPSRNENSKPALKIASRVQTPANKNTKKVDFRNSPPKVKEFWPDVELTRTRTRPNPPKRPAKETEEVVPVKKVKVADRSTRLRARQAVAIAKKAKQKPAPSRKRIIPRTFRPSVSPPPPKTSHRGKTELQERVCETCQQIFYSGTELALHELRHTGKVLRLSLDKFEIPEPLQKMKKSFLFQQPVNLGQPAQEEKVVENPQFNFGEPQILADPALIETLEEKEKVKEALESCAEVGNEFEDQEEFGSMAKDDSVDSTQQVVGNLIDSLEEKPSKTSKEEEEDKAPLITNILSFDFFPPSSPKEVRKSVDSSDELKTPPLTSTTALAFDFFGAEAESSPPKSNLFSPPVVDPEHALKDSSVNPSLPLPSDSDNSLILTPPKGVAVIDEM
ncbi:uncharacterized protein LOC132199039 isoform X2 [Neocloeon triangulifer]|uniref:uncharacterized protein LOC132199039 isoform X2 n=1 Tax=Neocloeon triangulifer TaxID=2078957 RepID=UPI00286ED4FA|nr:uncharacterized protein LOC132199039 isoform X2 [Neocloeon triangulifer]